MCGIEIGSLRPATFHAQSFLEGIEEAIAAVEKGLTTISDEDLERDFPVSFKGKTLSAGLFLTHLVAHFAYHLGQIDYHRRLVTGQSDGVGAISIPALLE